LRVVKSAAVDLVANVARPTDRHEPFVTPEPRAWLLPATTPLRLPPLPALRSSEVVVVEVGLDIAEAVRQWLYSILDEDERARAGRFVFAHDRRRYVAAHGALRLVLAHYLDADPRLLRFERSAHGKPRLAGRMAGDCEINLSHSSERALIAVARAREVGVDIEVHRSGVDVHALAPSVLSPAEQRAFAALPPAGRRAAFFRAWARKESFVKAIGEGLACPLGSFDVSLDEQTDSALLACRHLPAAGARWMTIPLDVGADAAAALTAPGPLCLRRQDAAVWTFAANEMTEPMGESEIR
jgi:4'-phosphopantetheinyl transferase